jgi:pimeloyl-ACP methyl ester carboxylesterase
MTTLIEIPALGCNGQLYAHINPLLPSGLTPHVLVAVADRMAGCVEQILAQAPEHFVVLGTSFGARVAMEVALAAPERVKGLIIIGSGPGPVADQMAGLKRSARIRGDEFDAVLQEMGDIISHLPGPNGPDTMHAFRDMARDMGAADMALQSDALAYREDMWPRISEITCPVLCLWGDHDQFSAPDVGRQIAEAVPNGEFEELAECGHFPTLEYPHATAAAIGAWLFANKLI